MEKVRKVFFDPLVASKAQIREMLHVLPIGSAHPFSPEKVLICRTQDGTEEIDISSYPSEFFCNAVDLGHMSEDLLMRMADFPSKLDIFRNFQILQAPVPIFKVPILSDKIAILAFSQRDPTYYDLCLADASYNTCCWSARTTLPGISHSGDIKKTRKLLHCIRINEETLPEKEICVFISGYDRTPITKFLGTNPALLVADYANKALYIVPVPLDTATIGQATICCPLVIKREEDSLICSILSTAATDLEISCFGEKLESDSFAEAIQRADFTISTQSPSVAQKNAAIVDSAKEKNASNVKIPRITKDTAVFTTDLANLPSFLDLEKSQIIRFGSGIEFKLPDEELPTKTESLDIVLPCIFGSQLQGPFLLATGTAPSNVPFTNEVESIEYYRQLKNAVVIVDDRMTDNARNLATSYRINALFVVKISPQSQPKSTNQVTSLLNSANINAVTALAGPQSLILIQTSDRYYFYRGLANRAHINTSKIKFGSEITSTLESAGIESILDPRIERIITLDNANTIILPTSGQFVRPQDLENLFEDRSISQIKDLEEDMLAAVPQLQTLLNEKDLKTLSNSLVLALSTKINSATAALRDPYIKFLIQDHNVNDPESVVKKNFMFGKLRKATKDIQTALVPLISNLANMMSVQATSKRTHDLKRLVRRTQIQANVEATKTMTFDALAEYLETYAGEMGVMLLNIETTSYSKLLCNLKKTAIDARSCCSLDSRILYLEGFDAGIIIEQSQSRHDGPLRNETGPSQPILAVPYLSQGSGTGSMLAWVCWDEFVKLKDPYTVRWTEKCNDEHIAALRIIMRSTLSQAVESRKHNIKPNSPETGHLMSVFLMAAMSKLAMMRTTTPVVSEKVEDTVTKLMRGLFGNLLTIAGSGTRPLSMVWQLFGLNPQCNLPHSDVDWIWYETVVALYPYTEWPLRRFYQNLEKLLDKAIIRVVTRNENVERVRMSQAVKMAECCKLRNIQLEHSRTITTVLMRAYAAQDTDIAAVAARLMKQLPQSLERQSEGFARMIRYIEHLSKGGQRRVHDDSLVANVFISRSAAFAELKNKVSKACQRKEWARVKAHCQAIMDKHSEIANVWHVNPETLRIQNIAIYRELLNTDLREDISEAAEKHNLKLTHKVLSDAEICRVPWRVGKKGEFGDDIEPLHENLLHEIVTGESSQAPTAVNAAEESGSEMNPSIGTTSDDGFMQFTSLMLPSFITMMQKDLSAEDVCRTMKVPVTAMRVFVKALNPNFVWDDLGDSFKTTILELLENRSNRTESRPTRRFLHLTDMDANRLIKGQCM